MNKFSPKAYYNGKNYSNPNFYLDDHSSVLIGHPIIRQLRIHRSLSGLNWNDSQAFCQNNGADLITINDYAELIFTRNTVWAGTGYYWVIDFYELKNNSNSKKYFIKK